MFPFPWGFRFPVVIVAFMESMLSPESLFLNESMFIIVVIIIIIIIIFTG